MITKALRFLTSLKLTVVLLGLMIIVSIPSTLIVQHQSSEYYFSSYSEAIANLILGFGYDHFFSSPIFLVIVGVFWINLFSCTIKRFIGQLKRGRKGKFGPDVLHLGLLVLIIGAMVTFVTRQEGLLFMAPGDAMVLPSGRYMVLDNFIFEQYMDGRPKSWISEVSISSSREKVGDAYTIEVNTPLRIDGLVIYQSSSRPSKEVGVYETGLMVTQDPGKIYVVISFILISVGLTFTFVQKRKVLY